MAKDFAPSAERNKDEILGALLDVLPTTGTILEVASGTGQHAVHFAPRFPGAIWQPSERRPEALASIRAYAAEAGLPNLREPLEIDVTRTEWPIEHADAMVNINMLHISPWSTCEGLLAGAGRVLAPGAPLFYYGAFFREDRETVPSNIDFDLSLKERNPAWGVKQLEEVTAFAETQGLFLDKAIDMPNNNYAVVFRRR